MQEGFSARKNQEIPPTRADVCPRRNVVLEACVDTLPLKGSSSAITAVGISTYPAVSGRLHHVRPTRRFRCSAETTHPLV